MRTAAVTATLLLILSACSTSNQNSTDSPFTKPNSLMAEEISRRIEQVPYLHREELLENLLWLSQAGEQTIPALLDGLNHENAKVRSSSAWVLGRLKDRRTIPYLQQAVRDGEPTVQLECARTLVLLGDLVHSPILIEGLDSDRKEVRYLCHEALKTSSGHDFGYDHLAVNQDDMRGSVLRWREWWSEYSGDNKFAASYRQKHHLGGGMAAPMGEVKGEVQMAPMQEPGKQSSSAAKPGNNVPANNTPSSSATKDGQASTGSNGNSAKAPTNDTGNQPAAKPNPAVIPIVRPAGVKNGDEDAEQIIEVSNPKGSSPTGTNTTEGDNTPKSTSAPATPAPVGTEKAAPTRPESGASKPKTGGQ